MSDVVARSDALDAEQPTIAANIDALAKASRRNRRILKWLAVSVALDVGLSLGLALLYRGQHEVTDKLERQSATQVQTCEDDNKGTALNLRLWLHILDIPPSSPRTPEQQAAADDFRAFVTETFAPRDCQAPR